MIWIPRTNSDKPSVPACKIWRDNKIGNNLFSAKIVTPNYLFIKLPWSRDNEENFRSSNQTAIFLPHTVEATHHPFTREHPAGKLRVPIFALAEPQIQPLSGFPFQKQTVYTLYHWSVQTKWDIKQIKSSLLFAKYTEKKRKRKHKHQFHRL